MSDREALAAFLAARYAEDWIAVRDRDLLTGDPAMSRETREVEARRQILLIHSEGGHSCPAWRHEGVDPDVWFDDGLCDTLRHMGSPYSDHRDYDQRWKP